MRLTYHKAIQDEVDDACEWYDTRKDDLGDEFFQEVERQLESISANPQAFPVATKGRRKAHLKRFPYTIYYRIHSDRVRILSLRHDKRHPSYGSSRRWPFSPFMQRSPSTPKASCISSCGARELTSTFKPRRK